MCHQARNAAVCLTQIFDLLVKEQVGTLDVLPQNQ